MPEQINPNRKTKGFIASANEQGCVPSTLFFHLKEMLQFDLVPRKKASFYLCTKATWTQEVAHDFVLHNDSKEVLLSCCIVLKRN